MELPFRIIAAPCAALLLALAGCAGLPFGQRADTGPHLSLDTLKDVTRTLSADEFEGRGTGTPGEGKTLAYMVERFAAAGLQPGNNGSWYQDVPLVKITAEDLGALNVYGPAADMLFAAGSDWIGMSYREQENISLHDSELVFVGYGVVAPERGWNDYAGIDMRGKTAVILVNDPDWRSETNAGPFNGRAMTYYGRWTYKFEEAARQGAQAALIVHEDYPAGYGWNVVERSWSGPQSRNRSEDRGASQTLVNGWISNDTAQAIASAAGTTLASLAAQAEQAGFRPVPLGLKVSTAFDNSLRYIDSKNVIGILPGRERPDEYVVHTAHWDHLGQCPPNEAGDDICNGAIDNALGSAALVALAEAQAKTGAAARSMVFLSVTAEEQGLLGSEYYAAHPIYPLDHTVGGLNIDGGSMAGPTRDVDVIGLGKSELDTVLARNLPKVGLSASPDSAPQAGYYYRSDHFSFAKRGVPMFNIKSGQDLVEGGREAGAAWNAEYRAHRYHAPDDEYDPAWDWRGVERQFELFYWLGRDLASSRQWPNWEPGDEFRTARDQSCAAAPGGC
ncbi:M28 family peptidase [Altererythrobacter salegens]|uniref:M28 family peptidase n=1 Tax=Croceibacterium salegens TaxID=1737568 RepID=A0A6I4SZU8_9SPHN|nr:M28 family metallopeptidase [Croceibacterium salegens]MXO59852.1 M28 family peptidase [Croceibacterium salegens]